MINEEIIRKTYIGPIAITTPNPITFSFDEKEDVRVLKVAADGTKSILAYGTGYTVDDSKNVFLIAPILLGDSITVYRVSAYDQQRDFVEDGRYRVVEVEKALDKLTMQNQEQADAIGRALTLALNTPTGFNAELPPPTSGRAVCFNQDGDGFEVSEQPINELVTAAEAILTQATSAVELAQAAIGNMPTVAAALQFLRRNADNTALEYVDALAIKNAIASITANDVDGIINLPAIDSGTVAGQGPAASLAAINVATQSGNVITFPATTLQYADIANTGFNSLGSQTWELIINITPTQVGVIQYIMHNSINAFGPLIGLNAANHFTLSLSSNNTSFDIASGSIGSYTAANGTNVYVKLEFTGTQYILSTSPNGTTWTQDIIVPSSLSVNASTLLGNWRFGQNISTPTVNTFKGTLDLSKCSCKIAGGYNSFAPTISSVSLTKDRTHTANLNSNANIAIPTFADTVLRNFMLDFNVQPGCTPIFPAKVKFDYNVTPTYLAYPDLAMYLATYYNMKLSFPATSGQYVDFNNINFVDAARTSTFEVIWHVTPAQVGALQYLMSSSQHAYAPCIGITAANKIALFLSNSYGAWDIANSVLGTYTVAAYTPFYLKWEFTGTQHKISTSPDGITWTIDITVATTSTCLATAALIGTLRLGQVFGSSATSLFKGVIDLNKSSIKVAGGRNLLTPEPGVYLNRVILDTLDGANHLKAHYSQVPV